jgi:hypothetical protein
LTSPRLVPPTVAPGIAAPEIGSATYAGFTSGSLPGAAAVEIPVLFESDGGVREIVVDVSHRPGTIALIDAVAGICLSGELQIVSERMDETPHRMRVTITSETPLPEGVLDLFRLRILRGGDATAADLRITTVSINGRPITNVPPKGVNTDGDPVTIDATEEAISLSLADDPPLPLDILVGALGARGPGSVLVAPEALSGGYVAMRIGGVTQADELRLRFAYERGAIVPQNVLPTMDGATVTIEHDADAGEFELVASDVAALAAEIAVLACVAFARPAANGRQTGMLSLRGVSVDGVDLPVEEELSDWTGPQGASYAFAASDALRMPLTPGPLHKPDR